MDWTDAPFPYEWELDRLRRLSRTLRWALWHVDSAGVWLAGVKAAWPRDANVRLAQWTIKRTQLADKIRGLVERVGKLK